MNIYVCRARWHVGVGIDSLPEWDRWALVKEQLNELGLFQEVRAIEREVSESMEKLWQK